MSGVDLSSAAYLLGYIRARKIVGNYRVYESNLGNIHPDEYLMGYDDGLEDEDAGVPHHILGTDADPASAYEGKIISCIPMTDLNDPGIWHIYIHDQDQQYSGVAKDTWQWQSNSPVSWVRIPK